MIHRALTTAGDWTFGKGLNSFAHNRDAIVLNVKTRLRSWRGDCFFALAEGVDYSNYLDKGTKGFLDSHIKRVILMSEGVLRIVSYESVLREDSRGVTIVAEIDTIHGQAKVEV